MEEASIKLTYQLSTDAPPPWSWEQYEQQLSVDWRLLLKSDPAEAEVHRFMELHPCMIPGGDGGGNSVGGHHGPVPDAVVSEPELPGIRRPRPDFLWITYVSSEVKPVLVEIEKPAKKWFTGAGIQTERLSQAIGQLASWRAWLDSEVNRLQFYERYEVDDYVRRHHAFHPIFCLIYGRRSEFSTSSSLSKQRAGLRPEWLDWMTYDRLRPLAGARNCVSARVNADGWTVVAIPPTYRLGPSAARTLVRMDGWETAIAANGLISPERKQFLIGRLDYWRDWVASGEKASRAGDSE